MLEERFICSESKSSKEDRKEQEEVEEKEKKLYKRKMIRDFAKSPSIILKDADAQYYDRTKNPQVWRELFLDSESYIATKPR